MLAARGYLKIFHALLHVGNFEHLAQIGEEGIVIAHGFAWTVGEFGYGLTVAFHQFEHDVQGFVPHVVSEIGADAEADKTK